VLYNCKTVHCTAEVSYSTSYDKAYTWKSSITSSAIHQLCLLNSALHCMQAARCALARQNKQQALECATKPTATNQSISSRRSALSTANASATNQTTQQVQPLCCMRGLSHAASMVASLHNHNFTSLPSTLPRHIPVVSHYSRCHRDTLNQPLLVHIHTLPAITGSAVVDLDAVGVPGSAACSPETARLPSPQVALATGQYTAGQA
jgi:hypothetical protein